MSDCQIFTAFTAAERIWAEIEALVEEVSSSVKQCSKDNVKVQTSTWGDACSADAVNSSNCWCDCLLRLRLKGKGAARTRLLTLYFDLTRNLVPREKDEWPHAREALVIIGF